MKRSSIHRHLLAVALAAFATSFSTTGHAQNLLTNPSFELGGFVDRGDGFQILDAGSTAMTGWTVINDTIAWGTTPNSGTIVPFDGSFFLDLQGDGVFGAPYGGVTQSIPTIIGQPYHFSFNLGTQQDVGVGVGPVSVSATAGGTSMPFTFDPTGNGTQWGEFGFDFTATSATTSISLIGTFTAGGAYIGLDAAAVNIVPEPTALAVFGAMGLLTALRRPSRVLAA